jgi:hypothetical protein
LISKEITMTTTGKKLEDEIELAAGAPSPVNWRLYGLVALAVLVFILLVMRFMAGNEGTAVIPGTPTTASQSEAPPQ